MPLGASEDGEGARSLPVLINCDYRWWLAALRGRLDLSRWDPCQAHCSSSVRHPGPLNQEKGEQEEEQEQEQEEIEEEK